MKRWLLLVVLSLVGCSDGKVDGENSGKATDTETEEMETVEEKETMPVTTISEPPKELTQEEKDKSDVETVSNYISEIKPYFNYFLEIDEKFRKGAFSSDKTNSLYLSSYSNDARAELIEVGNAPSIYNEEYEAKFNELYILLMESYGLQVDMALADYQESQGTISIDEDMKIHDEYVLTSRPLIEIWNAAIEYHNSKYAEINK